MIQVIDNCLSNDNFATIYNTLTSQEFPWFFLNNKVGEEYRQDHIHNSQFTHMFYSEYKQKSNYASIIEPILEVLNPKAIVKIKSNMTMPTSHGHVVFPMHVDVENFVGGTTAIYYVNTNDGYTEFENGEKIESVENRLVIFDSTIKHTGTTSTDTKFRSVINFNYYAEKK